MHELTVVLGDGARDPRTRVVLDGIELDCAQLAITAGVGALTEVTLKLSGVRVNYASRESEYLPNVVVTQSMDQLRKIQCSACGGYFINGDGHKCEGTR